MNPTSLKEMRQAAQSANEFDYSVFSREWFREHGFMKQYDDDFKSSTTFQEVARYVGRWQNEKSKAELTDVVIQLCDEIGKYKKQIRKLKLELKLLKVVNEDLQNRINYLENP